MDIIPVTKQNISVSDESIGLPKSYFGALSADFSAGIIERLKGAGGLYSLFSLEYLFDDDNGGVQYPAPVFNIDVKLEAERIREIVEKYGKSEKETERIVERILETRMVKEPAKTPVKPLRKSSVAPQAASDSVPTAETAAISKNIFNSSIQSVFNQGSKYNYYFSGTDNRVYRFFAPAAISEKSANPLTGKVSLSDSAHARATGNSVLSARTAKHLSDSGMAISRTGGMSFADSLKYAQEHGLTFGASVQENAVNSDFTETSFTQATAPQAPLAITREEYFSPSLDYTDESGETSEKSNPVSVLTEKELSAVADSVASAISGNQQSPLPQQPTLKIPAQPSPAATVPAVNDRVEMIYTDSAQDVGNSPSTAAANNEASVINAVSEKTFLQKLAELIRPGRAAKSDNSRTSQSDSVRAWQTSVANETEKTESAPLQGVNESGSSAAYGDGEPSVAVSRAPILPGVSGTAELIYAEENGENASSSPQTVLPQSSDKSPLAAKQQTAQTDEMRTPSSRTAETPSAVHTTNDTPPVSAVGQSGSMLQNNPRSANGAIASSLQNAASPELVFNESAAAADSAEQMASSAKQRNPALHGEPQLSQKKADDNTVHNASASSAPSTAASVSSAIRSNITLTGSQSETRTPAQATAAEQQAVELVYSEAEARNIIVNSENPESGTAPVHGAAAAIEKINGKSASPSKAPSALPTAAEGGERSQQSQNPTAFSTQTAVTPPIETAHIDGDIRTSAPLSASAAVTSPLAADGQSSASYDNLTPPAQLIYAEDDAQAAQQNPSAEKTTTQNKSEPSRQGSVPEKTEAKASAKSSSTERAGKAEISAAHTANGHETPAEKSLASAARAAQRNANLLSRLTQPIKTARLDGDIRSSAAKSFSANGSVVHGQNSQTSLAQDYSVIHTDLTDAPVQGDFAENSRYEAHNLPYSETNRSRVNEAPSAHRSSADAPISADSSAVTDAKLLEVAKVLGNLNSSDGSLNVLKNAGLIKNDATPAQAATQTEYSQSPAETFYPEQAAEESGSSATVHSKQTQPPFTATLADKVIAAANELVKNSGINNKAQNNSPVSSRPAAQQTHSAPSAAEFEHMQELTYAEINPQAQGSDYSAPYRAESPHSSTEFSPVSRRFNAGQNISSVEPMYPSAETFLNMPQAQQAPVPAAQTPAHPFTAPPQAAYDSPAQKRAAPRQTNFKPGTAPDTVVWSAPTMPAPPIVHKEKNPADAEQTTRRQQQMTDAEIKRTADKVYKIIEERLKTERRRMGL